MRKLIIVAGLGCAGLLLAIVIALIVIGSIGPDTAVYHGRQLPKQFMATIRSLNLLEEGEQIRYFYSDAVIDNQERPVFRHRQEPRIVFK